MQEALSYEDIGEENDGPECADDGTAQVSAQAPVLDITV